MDHSPLYQTMCRQAKEVQHAWSPAQGDLYVLAGDPRVYFWLDKTAPRTFKKGFAIFHKEKIIRLEARIWLPRQSQLMELAQVPGVRFQDMNFRFYTFFGSPSERRKHPELREFDTLEQLWLTFIMFSRFKKCWKNPVWIPIADKTP